MVSDLDERPVIPRREWKTDPETLRILRARLAEIRRDVFAPDPRLVRDDVEKR